MCCQEDLAEFFAGLASDDEVGDPEAGSDLDDDSDGEEPGETTLAELGVLDEVEVAEPAVLHDLDFPVIETDEADGDRSLEVAEPVFVDDIWSGEDGQEATAGSDDAEPVFADDIWSGEDGLEATAGSDDDHAASTVLDEAESPSAVGEVEEPREPKRRRLTFKAERSVGPTAAAAKAPQTEGKAATASRI